MRFFASWPGLATTPLSMLLVACQAAPASSVPASSGPTSRTLTAAAPADAASVIGAEGLREHVARLASDELAGRGPGSAGDVRTRGYLAERLAALGALPGPGASWEQPLELVGVTSAMPEAWAFERAGRTLSLAWWEQYLKPPSTRTRFFSGPASRRFRSFSTTSAPDRRSRCIARRTDARSNRFRRSGAI